jgi:threonylcarbamoyladenosine tRNA methylthiotransferase MtaB
VVLTGVDITSYGADLPGEPTLGKLVQASCGTCRSCRACACPPSIRSRPTGPARGDRRGAALMPHLHLSLQAGDDMILKRMKRRHSAPTPSRSATT